MTPDQLVKFLKRVYVWLPQNHTMRNEIKQVILQLGGDVFNLN